MACAFSPSKTKIPSCPLPNPISSSAQIIPSETSPLIFPFLILNGSPSSGYKVVPIVATITFCPLATLEAPQTIDKTSSAPISTVVQFKWSEFGCGSHVMTSPTTKPSKPPFICSKVSIPSTSSPVSVRYSAIFSADSSS